MKKAILLIPLLVMLLFLNFPQIPVAHATGPIVRHHFSCNWVFFATSCSVTMLNVNTDTAFIGCTAADFLKVQPCTITSNGTGYTALGIMQSVSVSNANVLYSSGIAYFNMSGSGHTTITTSSSSFGGNTGGLVIVEMEQGGFSKLMTNSAGSACGQTSSVNAPVLVPTSSYYCITTALPFDWGCAIGTSSVNGSDGWVRYTGNGGGCEWNLGSPTDYSFGASSSFFALVGFGFGVAYVNSVVACTFTQIQCWYYPILFMGMYDALFFTQGILARVSTKGLIYLMLSGFTLGSIVALLMGILGIQLVILCMLSLVIWFWRFRS
jgi:hypothetical protein